MSNTITAIRKKTKQAKTVTFVEHPTGQSPEVHQNASLPVNQELLRAFPEREPEGVVEVQGIYVRCDRRARRWVQCERNGKFIRYLDCAVMADVQLSSQFQAEGCGGEYTGIACGAKLSPGKPVTVPEGMVKTLEYDPHRGEFTDQIGCELTQVDYLILMENCQHAFIKAGAQ